jgi:hypothetical protein
MLASLADRRAAKAAAVNQHITTLESEAAKADERLRRLYRLAEDGITTPDDLLRDRLAALKTEQEALRPPWNAPEPARGQPRTSAPSSLSASGRSSTRS